MKSLFMSETTAIEIFRGAGAVMNNGHFAIDEERHSDSFLIKELLGAWPHISNALGVNLALPFMDDDGFETVVCPETGAAIFGSYVAEFRSQMLEPDRATGVVYVERGEDDKYQLYPPFTGLIRHKRVLITEDIVNTGETAKELMRLVQRAGGEVIGVSAIWNCGGVPEDAFGVKFHAIVKTPLRWWPKGSCPMCAKGVPVDCNVGFGRKTAMRT